jgi:NAD(P)-dependent dehydrogenase (short-subunit alcohol dehydrogenase family)
MTDVLRFAAPFEQRVALITGGAMGIGEATALRLAEAGRDIVIADIDPRGEHVAAEVEKRGRRALWAQTDMTDESAVHALIGRIVEAFGRLDILACCAGLLGTERPFMEQPAAELDRVMRVNVYGVYYCHQAAIPHMLARGWGRCVTITSGARHGSTMLVPYSISKGAVYSLVKALGNAYPRQGVFVNGVEPGRALTRMVVPRFTPEFLADPGNPIGRYSDANEVAEVIEFLCSERNTYTTGAVWSVKGGSD